MAANERAARVLWAAGREAACGRAHEGRRDAAPDSGPAAASCARLSRRGFGRSARRRARGRGHSRPREERPAACARATMRSLSSSARTPLSASSWWAQAPRQVRRADRSADRSAGTRSEGCRPPFIRRSGTRVTGGLTILASGPAPPRGVATPSDCRLRARASVAVLRFAFGSDIGEGGCRHA